MYVTQETHELSGGRARVEFKLDLKTFAVDLAVAMGRPWVAGPVEPDCTDVWADIISPEYKIILYNTRKGKVELSIKNRDLQHGEAPMYGNEFKTVSITVNPDGRPIAAVAKDVLKRLVEANKPALAKIMVWVKEQRAAKNGASYWHGFLTEQFKNVAPKVKVDLAEGSYQGRIWLGTESYNTILEGTFNQDGEIGLKDSRRVSVEQFEKIVKVLKGEL